jgi:hypothetical protein
MTNGAKGVPCWICGGLANTGEHKAKRSDLKSVFGTVSQAAPLFFNDAANKNRRIGSFNADEVKWAQMLCGACNSTRTQPHDRAWTIMSTGLRSWTPRPRPGAIVRANRIFPHDTARAMLNVHLYFAKAFGCLVVEAADVSLRIDLSAFGRSIMGGIARPDFYLGFGVSQKFVPGAVVSTSDLHVVKDNFDGGAAALATWFYNVNGVCVLIAYAPGKDGMIWAGKENLWHPRNGSNRLNFRDFKN